MRNHKGTLKKNKDMNARMSAQNPGTTQEKTKPPVQRTPQGSQKGNLKQFIREQHPPPLILNRFQILFPAGPQEGCPRFRSPFEDFIAPARPRGR
ncbi:hypothetical protein JTB14_005809 [Gonioctena quinquepunctata]|nr:hypothetical protein JTB14_005809 [Gonioctena quinquepunctata]